MLINKLFAVVAITAISTAAFAKPTAVREAIRDTKIEEKNREAAIKVEASNVKSSAIGKELSKMGWMSALEGNASTLMKLDANSVRKTEALAFASKFNPAVKADVNTVQAVLQHMAVTTGNFKSERYVADYQKIEGSPEARAVLDSLLSNGAYYMTIKGKSTQEAELLAINKVKEMKAALETAKKEGSNRAITKLNDTNLAELSAAKVAELKAIDKDLKDNGCKNSL